MDSYNSQYPLEYYEVGTPYMFYLSTGTKHGTAASMDLIKKYSPVLNKTASQKGAGYCFADRVIGVVVNKEIINERTGAGAITVLFQGTADNKTVYMTTKYITNLTGGVFCDDKELFPAAGIVELTGEIQLPSAPKGGGIALDGGRPGGIALDGGNQGGGIALDN